MSVRVEIVTDAQGAADKHLREVAAAARQLKKDVDAAAAATPRLDAIDSAAARGGVSFGGLARGFQSFRSTFESFAPVASSSIHEIQKAVLVAIDQFVERSRFAIEKRADDSTVVEPAKVLSNCRTRRSNSRT
jgi:hypothetical protein